MEKHKCKRCKNNKPFHEFQLLVKAAKSTMKSVYSSFCHTCVQTIKRENVSKIVE